MARTNIRVKNLSTVTSAIAKMGDMVKRGVQDEIAKSISNIQVEATNKANAISSELKIDEYKSDSGMTGIVSARHFANINLAAYIEFGTGIHAASLLQNYPQEVRDLAKQFYVNGKGRLFGRPYLIPAFLVERKKFLNNVKKVLRKAVK